MGSANRPTDGWWALREGRIVKRPPVATCHRPDRWEQRTLPSKDQAEGRARQEWN